MQIELNSRGILSAIFRQRMTIILISVISLISGGIYLYTTTPIYESSGSILMKFGRDAAPELSKSDSSPNVISQNDRREIMQSSIDILRSHNLLQAIVNEAGAERIYPGLTEKLKGKDSPTEVTVFLLQSRDINIKAGQQSNVIEIGISNEDPKLAAWINLRLLTLFIAKQSEMYNPPQTDFLQEQVDKASQKLAKSQIALKAYKASVGISSIEEELAQLLKEKGQTNNSAFESADKAQERLADLQAEEASLLAIYQPENPRVEKVRQSIAVARRQLGARQADLKARTGKSSGMLGTQVSNIDKRIAQLEEKRSQYNDLARQVSMDEENYKNYQSRSEEARVNTMLNERKVTRVSIVDEPIAPMRPSKPRKLLVLAITLLSSLVFGIGFAFMREVADMRFTTPEQISTLLGIPVMATIPAPAKEAA